MASTPINTVQGAASGIQWQDMIDQIIAADSTPITNLQSQITTAQSKESAWNTYKADIQALSDAASGLSDGSALGGLKTSIAGLAAGGGAPFSATTGTGAVAGDYQVAVTRLAAAEKLGGASYASSSQGLTLSGEFLLNGRAIQVNSGDSLAAVAQSINNANTGTSPIGVAASVVATTTGGYRLVLSSAKTGAAGIALKDGATGVLHSLGLLDASETAKNPSSNGLRSDGFTDASAAVGGLLKLTSPPLAANVVIGGVPVTIDLATDSLQAIANNYTAAATAAGKIGVSMTVATNAAGQQTLQYTGPTSFTDDQNALALLGFTQAGRGSVAQTLQGGTALVDSGTGSAATLASTFASLGSKASAGNPETITVAGTRGDGSAVSYSYATDGTQTLGDFVNALNASGVLGAAGRTATASLVTAGDGSTHLQVTDGTAGDSLLSLAVVANNEQGGTVDFGALGTAQTGQTREITAGADALFSVDGTPVQRSSNTVTDAIPGVTLTLTGTTTTAADLAITQDSGATVSAIQAFVAAYNKVADFITQQTTPPATGSGAAAPPLFSDSVMRSMRTSLNAAMQKILPSGVAGSWARLGDIGITIDKTGHYQVDSGKLSAAVAADPTSIQRLLGLSGSSANGAISYVTAGDATQDGSYSLVITQAAAPASATGFTAASGAGTMTVTDSGTGKSYAVTLADLQSAKDVAATLNAEFARSAAQVLAAGTAASDSGTGGAVTDATTWSNAQSSGSALAAGGDQLTVSGTKADGTSFLFDYTVSNSATLGDFRSQVQQQFGADATVSWDASGKLTVTAASTGSSLLSLAVTDGANAPFGSVAATTVGRPAAHLQAGTDASGKLLLTSTDYGSAAGFTVAYAGTDAGIAAGSYAGTDVAGTLNGQAATGMGQVLTGTAGTPAEGLLVKYSGTTLGSVGSLTFSRGVASSALLAAAPFLGTGSGSITSLTAGIDTQVADWNDRITTTQARLDQRKQQLTAQFTAMEQAIAKSQSQMQWLTGQISGLAGYGNTSSSSTTG